MSRMLELRVLSGLHHKARCPATHGALIGADPHCDIVLTDDTLPTHAARLILGKNGWALTPGDEEPTSNTPTDTAYNQPLMLGPIWITVADASDAWPAVPIDHTLGHHTATSSAAAALDTDNLTPSDPVTVDHPPASPEPLPLPHTSPPAQVDTALPPRRRSWAVTLGLTLVCLAIIITLLLAWLLPTGQATTKRPDPRVAAEQSLIQIQATLERLGLTHRLRARLPDNATTAQVSGWVHDAAERDALATALAQIWPMPAMRISVETEALQTARLILGSYSVKYEPRYDGDGRLSLLGIAANESDRTAAIDAVQAQLPGMAVMGNNILLATDVADVLTRELAAAGLSGVTLTWEPHSLSVDASTLDDEQMAQFEQVLAKFNPRYLNIATLPNADRPPSDKVPFGIISVVSGKTPFLVLEDGSKLLVGGTYQRYRLTDIEANRLIFDGPRPAIVLR